MQLFNSRYNFSVPTEQGFILYNSRTGGTIHLQDEDIVELLPLLTGRKMCFCSGDFSSEILSVFLKNGFLVSENTDELLEIQEKYWTARGDTPIVYTITTTMDCNLGCYYCFENRSKHALQSSDIDQIIFHIAKTFSNTSKKSLHVDWFGGEPLLNFNFLEEASIRIQEFCRSNNINYHASIVSNGTLWPSEVGDFIQNHKIRQVQISFDGMKQNHDKVRRYRKEYNQGNSSFEEAVELIEKLLDFVRVDIRYNISILNRSDLDPFLDLMMNRKWFTRSFPLIFQPARVSAYTEKSSFISDMQLDIEQFEQIKDYIKGRLSDKIKVDEADIPYGFPFPKNYVCAALANDSHIVDAKKFIHRCALDVGENHRSVGHFEKSDSRMEANKSWWDEFDPCKLPSCSKCSFLPICFGGCAKKHLDRDQKFLDEQSIYWRNHLRRMITGYLGFTTSSPQPLEYADQFRDGYDVE